MPWPQPPGPGPCGLRPRSEVVPTSIDWPAGGVLAGEDEQGAQHAGGLAGVEPEPGEDPPVLEAAEAVLDGGAGG